MNRIPRVHEMRTSAYHHQSGLLSKVITILVFIFFVGVAGANAQGPHPSCNISGPLEAAASGPDIIITVEVANSGDHPQLNYNFTSNTSGAFIRSQGQVVYNRTKNSVTQRITISPGTHSRSEFNLKLSVVTPSGSSQCSKSVSVS